MKNRYLQTIVSACAWCSKTIGVENYERESGGDEHLILLSHGICLKCNDNILLGDEKSEDESEDESEDDLVFA